MPNRRKYSGEFRREAVARLKDCSSVTGLARELGIRRKWLYEWKKQFPERCGGVAGNEEPAGGGSRESKPQQAPGGLLVGDPGAASEQRRLRERIGELERLTARQALEIDFFRGALRRVNERRAANEPTGAKASTVKSGPERSSKAE